MKGIQMSDEIRVNRPPMMQQRPEQPMPVQPESQPPRSSKMPWIILVVVVVVLVVLGVLFRGKLFNKAGGGVEQGANVSGYQAVFLTNGQVYFGKLSNVNKDYVTLADIYYLQVIQPPLQGQSQTGQQAQQQISLVKLGQELHGPVDEMHISRSQILFYEDMKTDGKVVQAIKAYQASQSAATPAAAPATAPAAAPAAAPATAPATTPTPAPVP